MVAVMVAVMVTHVPCYAGKKNWLRRKKVQLSNSYINFIVDVSVSVATKFVRWVREANAVKIVRDLRTARMAGAILTILNLTASQTSMMR